jgi:D-glycero-D-manno-heptose 1,7-bisphosphate phosphatase
MSLIILDRDGVINEDSPEYIKRPEEWFPILGSLEAMARLTQAGHTIAIATNQSGIGRGYYDLAALAAIHAKMLSALKSHGGQVDCVCFCPHRPEDECQCRKPKPGLFQQIGQLLQADLHQAIAVGDSVRDLQAAHAVGCTLIGVKTGNGASLVEASSILPLTLYADLAAWVDVYLSH